MLHLLYVIAFTVLAFLAVGNLIRSLITLSTESHKLSAPSEWNPYPAKSAQNRYRRVPQPEFLDNNGNVVNEPLLVLKSMTVEDARTKLDALYNSSPEVNGETSEQA